MEIFFEHPALFTYLFLQLKSINFVLGASLVVLFAAMVVVGCWWAGTQDDYNKKYKPEVVEQGHLFAPGIMKRLAVAFLVSITLFVAVPSQKDAAIILGVTLTAGVVERIADSPLATKATQALLIYAEKTLDEVINESKPKEKQTDAVQQPAGSR